MSTTTVSAWLAAIATEVESISIPATTVGGITYPAEDKPLRRATVCAEREAFVIANLMEIPCALILKMGGQFAFPGTRRLWDQRFSVRVIEPSVRDGRGELASLRASRIGDAIRAALTASFSGMIHGMQTRDPESFQLSSGKHALAIDYVYNARLRFAEEA